ncbi:MAG: zinc ribbon domain-containing protein [Methanobacterium sp.]
MVSTILCPRCKTQNSKKAEVCYKCNNTLKVHKKPSILSTNPKSKIELKIIAVGVTIFVASNILLLNIAYDYIFMISGFATMLYLYFAFKNSPMYQDSTKKNLRSAGFKIILNYLIIVALGIISLYGLGYV